MVGVARRLLAREISSNDERIATTDYSRCSDLRQEGRKQCLTPPLDNWAGPRESATGETWRRSSSVPRSTPAS